jgi:hypothetical protein
MTEVVVHWRDASAGDGTGWDQRRCLYAYRARSGEILYIGKAWGKTVWERWQFEAKPHFWTDLERKRKIFEHSTSVGTLTMYPGTRLTEELLVDVESLLINRLGIWGNIQCRNSRIERPGLVISCRGDWRNAPRRFRDVA